MGYSFFFSRFYSLVFMFLIFRKLFDIFVVGNFVFEFCRVVRNRVVLV